MELINLHEVNQKKRLTKMLNWEDKNWINNYLNEPKVIKLHKKWGKSEIESIKIAIHLRRLINSADNADKIGTDKDTLRSIMLGMHERGKEVNTKEMQDAIKAFNYVVDLNREDKL